jgi:hypothetical protein
MKKRYYKILHESLGNGYITDKETIWNTLDAELDGFLEYGEIGDEIIIRIVEFEEKEVEELPEFGGW